MNVEFMILTDKITDNDTFQLKSFIADEKIERVVVSLNSSGGSLPNPKYSEFIDVLKSDKVIVFFEPSHVLLGVLGLIADKNMKIGTKVKLNK